MIKCEICKKEFKQINNSHLIEHGINKIEYKKLFPKAKLRKAWNLGLTKEGDERVLKNSISSKKNHWSKDSKKREEIVKNISEKHKGKTISESVKQQFREQFKGEGNPNFGNYWSDEKKKKSSKKMKEKYKDPEYFAKFKESHWSNNEDMKKHISKKHSEFMSEAISSGKININTGYECGWFDSKKMNQSFYYMSSYELKRMKLFESSELVSEYTNKHGIKLKYKKENGSYSNYIPDILITFTNGKRRLEEIKGYIKDEKVFKSKNKVARHFCKKNDIEYKIILKKDLDIL